MTIVRAIVVRWHEVVPLRLQQSGITIRRGHGRRMEPHQKPPISNNIHHKFSSKPMIPTLGKRRKQVYYSTSVTDEKRYIYIYIYRQIGEADTHLINIYVLWQEIYCIAVICVIRIGVSQGGGAVWERLICSK
jgi:hypothetical protein